MDFVFGGEWRTGAKLVGGSGGSFERAKAVEHDCAISGMELRGDSEFGEQLGLLGGRELDGCTT